MYYRKCLDVNPNHKDARASLQILSKVSHRPNFTIDFPDIENGSGSSKKFSSKSGNGEDAEGRKSRRHKKRGKRTSSSSSGSSSSSRFSSSGSDSSGRGRSRSKKQKKSVKHEPSLSPFSKKMALQQLNPTSVSSGKSDVAGSQASFYPSTEYPAIATQPHPVPPPSLGKPLCYF